MNYWGRNEGIQTAPKITDGNFLTSSTLCMKTISLFSNIQIKKKSHCSVLAIIPSSLHLCIFVPFHPLYPSTFTLHFWSLKCFKCL